MLQEPAWVPALCSPAGRLRRSSEPLCWYCTNPWTLERRLRSDGPRDDPGPSLVDSAERGLDAKEGEALAGLPFLLSLAMKIRFIPTPTSSAFTSGARFATSSPGDKATRHATGISAPPSRLAFAFRLVDSVGHGTQRPARVGSTFSQRGGRSCAGVVGRAGFDDGSTTNGPGETALP